MAEAPIRLLSYEQLRERGITHTKNSLWRLERAGKFPRRITAGRVAWVEAEIDEYLRKLVAMRDGEAA